MRDFHVRREPRERYGVDGGAARDPGRPGRRRTSPAIRRLAARMNAEPTGRRAVGLGRRDRGARAAPRDRPRADRSVRASGAGGRRWPTALRDLRRPARAGRRPAARPVRRRSSRAAARSPSRRPPPRGAAADPDLEREPGARPAARARRRPAPRRGHAIRRGDRRARVDLRRRAAGRHARDCPDRADAGARPPRPDVARRSAPLHPRALGRPARAAPWSDCSAGSTWPSASSPRRNAASTCGSVAAPAAGRSEARRSRAPRRRARGVLVRLGLDAAGRADGQEHVRLARPAVAHATAATSGPSTRSPTRSSTRSPAGASPGCG